MQLQEVLERLNRAPTAQRADVERWAHEQTKALKWVPNPGPQTEAYFCKADILLYGGEPGGGKSDLLLGLAFNCHQRSLIMRREYTTLSPLLEGALRIHGSREGFNGQPPPKLRIDPKRSIDFGAAARAGDEQDWQGNPHDFIGFDEGTQFLYSQVRFLMGWLRTSDPGQRTRVVIATNPPMNPEGLWVVDMFAPWLDDRHPRPAKPGELRWFITDEEGRDREVAGPEAVVVPGRPQPVRPLSRTFIPAAVADNPFLANTDYQSKLDAMIEPFRSILLGKFKTTIKDQPFQVIPTAWVREAMSRWSREPPRDVPMCALGVDPVEGGKDSLTIAARYDGWYAPIVVVPGKDIKLGSQVAGHVVANRRHDADIVLDMGGGYGGGCYQTLLENGIKPIAYKGAGASTARTKDRKLGFTNKRAETHWKFREALDPDQMGGSPIALPEDPELLADLTAPTFEVTPRGIKITDKDDVKKLLGRSPDKGDAVVMAWASNTRAPANTPEYRREQMLKRQGRHAVDLGPRYRNRSHR